MSKYSPRTCHCQLGVGNVGATHHAVVALITWITVVDLQTVEVAHAGYLILVAMVQSLGAFVPAEGDLWVVDLNLTPEGGTLVVGCLLVSNVLQH